MPSGLLAGGKAVKTASAPEQAGLQNEVLKSHLCIFEFNLGAHGNPCTMSEAQLCFL